MHKQITYDIREPIGSSTYPKPDRKEDVPLFLTRLNLPSEEKLRDKSTLYIHIPFCDQICSFCGFNKYKSTDDKKEHYLKALHEEIKRYASTPYVQSLRFKAVYIGGGTPTSLSPNQLGDVLDWTHKYFNIDEGAEISCEGTPSSFSPEMISALKTHNVTRVSAGIQTFNRELRESHLNLPEGKKELLQYIDTIQNNFDNFNLDLIYNLPGQSDEIWFDDLSTMLSTKVSHLTLYPYVLLDKTRFYSQTIKTNQYELPTLARELDLFNKTLDFMESTRMDNRYTIRDWAQANKACQYVYLNAMSSPLLALGAGSFGYLAGCTYQNTRSLSLYGSQLQDEQSQPIEGVKICSEEDKKRRFMVMGLRLQALDMTKFDELFACDWKPMFGDLVQDLISSGYLTLIGQRLSFTREGLVWANNIRSEFEGEQQNSSVGYDTNSIASSGKSHYQEVS